MAINPQVTSHSYAFYYSVDHLSHLACSVQDLHGDNFIVNVGLMTIRWFCRSQKKGKRREIFYFQIFKNSVQLWLINRRGWQILTWEGNLSYGNFKLVNSGRKNLFLITSEVEGKIILHFLTMTNSALKLYLPSLHLSTVFAFCHT